MCNFNKSYLPPKSSSGVDAYRPAWRYFYGARWLPSQTFAKGQSVISVATTVNAKGEECVLAVTDGGISLITMEMWTLKKKAEWYQAMVEPRHDRFGMVCSCSLKSFGNLSSWTEDASVNSGLWTSIYLGSQIFRYAVTKVFS